MKKKNEEYIPQFNYDDLPVNEIEKKLSKCNNCGKESVSLHQGVCFECRQKQIYNTNISNKIKENKNSANENLYNQYREEVISNRTRPLLFGLIWRPLIKYGFPAFFIADGIIFILWTIPSALEIAKTSNSILSSIILFAFLILIGIALITIGILSIKFRKKIRHKKFEKFNKSVVKVSDYGSWECPSCRFVNDRIGHCERCGVLPILQKQ